MNKKDQIIRKLIQRYASEPGAILSEAAYNMSLAGVEVEGASSDRFWEKAERTISRIREATKNKPPSMLSEAAKKAYSTALAVCPLCKQKMNLVKLLEDREVFYCQEHKICQPLPIEGE